MFGKISSGLLTLFFATILGGWLFGEGSSFHEARVKELREGGDWKALVQFCTEAYGNGQEDRYLFYRAYGYYRLGQWDEAESDLNTLQEKGKQYGGFYKLRGDVAFAREHYDEAVENYKKALEQSSNKKEMERLFLNIGSAYEMGEHWEEAMDFYNRLARLNRKNKDLYKRQSQLEFGRGHWEEAMSYLDQGYKATHDDEFLIYKGDLAVAIGDLEKALPFYEEASVKLPSASVFIKLAKVHFQLKHYDGVIACYQSAFKGDPHAPLSTEDFRFLGQSYEKRGRLEEALEIYRKFYEQDKQDKKIAGKLVELARVILLKATWFLRPLGN